jgi:hypothetical protein
MDVCGLPGIILTAPLLATILSASVSAAGQSQAGSRSSRSRPDQVRSLTHSDPVIQRALMLIGQPLNPIRVAGSGLVKRLYARVSGAHPPPGLEAFRSGDPQDPLIYVYRGSYVYAEAASEPTLLADIKLAATLIHEQVHNTDREAAALRLQADFFRSQLRRITPHSWAAARRYLSRLDARAQVAAGKEWRRRQEQLRTRVRTIEASGGQAPRRR